MAVMHKEQVFIEVFRHRIQAIADEVASVILRTGYTVFVKETGDFGSVLFDPDGVVFALPLGVAVSLGVGMPCRPVIECIGQWDEGDVVVTNDPYFTKGMSTHLPDIYLIKPLFAEDQLVCFAAVFIHSSDVGGKVPGSITPRAYDLYQEGFRVRPCKLYSRGRLDEHVLHMILDNCRIPEQNWGDIKALLAGLHTAERRLRELVNRYGLTAVKRGIAGILDYAEASARAILRQIPAGVYEAWDYMETDGFTQEPIRIRVRMEVRDGEIALDFTGTEHQVRGAFNIPSFNQQGHFMISPTITRFLHTLDPGLPYNSGLVRPLSHYIPADNLLNASEGAPCGVRAATMIRVMDVLMAALSQAWPERLPSGGAGQACIVLLSMVNSGTGQLQVGVVQPITGGSGARPHRDGIDGTDFAVGFLRNIPTETLETEMPILIERYGLRADSFGAGRYRGGCGTELSVRVFVPDTVLTARGMERQHFRPWGRLGGRPGKQGVAILNRDRPDARETGVIDELTLQPGESITFLSPGGGGYGDPLDRPLPEVETDVEAGLLSPERAQTDFGVVWTDAGLDNSLSLERRRQLRKTRIQRMTEFDYGPEREAFESFWSDACYTALLEATGQYPLPLRGYLKKRAMRGLEALVERGEAITPEGVAAAVIQAAAQMTIGWPGRRPSPLRDGPRMRDTGQG